MDSGKADEAERAGSEKLPKAAGSADPSPPVTDKPTEKESCDALYNFPWSSIFAPYPYTGFKESSSKSKWKKGFYVSSSESSDEGEPGLAVLDWMQDPEFTKHLIIETGPSSPVLSPPEGEKPIDPKSIEVALNNQPLLLRPLKIAGFDETHYSDDDPYDPPTVHPHQNRDYVANYWEDDEYTNSPVISADLNEDHVLTGAGLKNLNNTCFMNSVMQCVVHTVPFFEGIISNTHSLVCSCRPGVFCLRCCLRELFQLLTSGKRSVKPGELVRNISYFSVSLRRGQQEDAHEFLLKLWTKLTECHDNDAAHSDNNFVRRVYGGRVVNKFTCYACGNVSRRTEEILDLQLPVEKPDSLLKALETHTKSRVPGYRCEKCGKAGAMQKIELDQVPPIVTFQLKRFGRVNNKIKKHVPFPLLLDLLPFAVTRDVELKYELYAIIVHEGETANVGHYYSFIRISPNDWFRFDDAVVSPVNEEQVLKQKAYILFYAKQGTAWFSDAVRAQILSKQSTLAASQPPVSAPGDNLQAPSPSELARGDEVSLTHGEEGSNLEGDRDPISRETAISFFPEFGCWHQYLSLDGGKEAGDGASLPDTDQNVSLGDARKVDKSDEDASLIGVKKADEDSETKASKEKLHD